MNFNVNSNRHTESLFKPTSIPPSFGEAQQAPATGLSSETALPLQDLAQVQAVQGESLHSLLLFPETIETPATAPPEALSREVQQGVELLNDLSLRRGGVSQSGNSTIAKPLDYALAKMSQEVSILPVNQLSKSLKELSTRLSGLGNRDQPPLTALEISQYNAALKSFGLMTDGQNLYNLSVRTPDPASGARKPMLCTRSDMDKLIAGCAAVQADFAMQPGSADPFLPHLRASALPSAPAQPAAASRFGAQSPESPRAFGLNTLSAIERISHTMSALNNFTDMLIQGESYITESAQMIDELLKQQQEVDQALGAAIERHEGVQTELQAQEQILSSLSDVAQSVQNSSDLNQSLRGDLGALNQTLAPLQLEVRRDSAGQLQFFKQGQAISEAEFRQALQQGVNRQTTTVASLNQELAQTEQNVGALRDRSETISTQLETAADKGRQGLAILEQASDIGQRGLQELLAIRNNPEAWNQLSDELKNQVNEKINTLQSGLQKIDQLTEIGRNSVSRAEEQLQRSASLREQADLAVARSQELRKRIADLLEQQREMRAQEQPLTSQAEQIEALLKREPAPDNQALQKLAESWLDSLQSHFSEAENLYQQHQKVNAQARDSFERAAQKLRENLNYHHEKLSDMDEQSRARLEQALQDSLAQTRALSQP